MSRNFFNLICYKNQEKIIIMALSIGLYLQHPKFGSLPEGVRLERIKSSPHYVSGQFQNLAPIPPRAAGSNSAFLWLEYLFTKKECLTPSEPIPAVKTDLTALDRNKDIVIWLGHSSYYMQLGGNRMLIDPVFSFYAAPVSFVNKAFKGTNLYTDHPAFVIVFSGANSKSRGNKNYFKSRLNSLDCKLTPYCKMKKRLRLQ